MIFCSQSCPFFFLAKVRLFWNIFLQYVTVSPLFLLDLFFKYLLLFAIPTFYIKGPSAMVAMSHVYEVFRSPYKYTPLFFLFP